ncbi:MAG: calcium/sodium antiporter [Coxiellaceae bacterium]|nr:calcium/sodium antiporter [Coxiellaceae bacterium]
MSISVSVVYIIVGCILLGIGANRFVISSVKISTVIGMSPLVAGVVLVGFGGSFPEIIVSIIASLKGQTQLAVGNAIGSNIVNVGLVLGFSAMLMPLHVHRHCFRRDYPLLLVTMIVSALLVMNDYLSRLDGVILLVLLLIYLVYMIVFVAKRHPEDIEVEGEAGTEEKPSIGWNIFWWLVGLGLLFVSSELLVTGASSIASHFGISELTIGLTVVAVGTSLPEFATTAYSALKKHHEIAMGNVLGSNIFNLLAVMAMPALIAPGKLSTQLLTRDFPVMVGIMLLSWLLAWLPPRKRLLGRLDGLVLFAVYILYLVGLCVGWI